MQALSKTIVVLGTGGTIAGVSPRADQPLRYAAGTLDVETLLASVPGLAEAARGFEIESETVAAIDSKDMDAAVWQRLARRCQTALGRPEVAGAVVTHGTDTLEETAWLLHRVLSPAKPLVLTAAMRPSTAASADGPGNLLDAVRAVISGDAGGVGIAMAGALWSPAGLRKLHTLRDDAFGAEAGPLARLDGGVWRRFRYGQAVPALGLATIEPDPSAWPRVEIVTNHAGADGRIVDMLLAAGVEGIVVAATGHGTVSAALDAALGRARQRGVTIRVASRCALGPVLPAESSKEAAGDLGPPQARVELLLELLLRRASTDTA